MAQQMLVTFGAVFMVLLAVGFVFCATGAWIAMRIQLMSEPRFKNKYTFATKSLEEVKLMLSLYPDLRRLFFFGLYGFLGLIGICLVIRAFFGVLVVQ